MLKKAKPKLLPHLHNIQAGEFSDSAL